jgi:hypothetical protein
MPAARLTAQPARSVGDPDETGIANGGDRSLRLPCKPIDLNLTYLEYWSGLQMSLELDVEDGVKRCFVGDVYKVDQ